VFINSLNLYPKISINKFLNYSPNFDVKKRKSNQIKFIIFHYTGMKKESEAIERLTSIQSKVSCHYLIKNNGEIVIMVPDLYEAWHAGVSSWRSFKSLNKNSIGIEISNPGHNSNYKRFSKKQIQSIKKLGKYLIKKYKINQKNILGHSDIAPTRKKDPGEKFPWKYLAKFGVGKCHSLSQKFLVKNRKKEISPTDRKIFFNNLSKIGYSKISLAKSKKNKFFNSLIIAFQRRFRQELVNGKIDQECLLISKNLIKVYN
jgi:N-acetylmuramoyl-L-alanine amidase